MIIVKSGRDDQVGGAGTPTHRDNNHNFTIQARSPPYRSLYRSPYEILELFLKTPSCGFM